MSKKRILTLIMTFVMLCTSFSIGYAETTSAGVGTSATTETITPLNSTGYRALRAMGFVGDELEGVDENAKITRAQFAAYLCKIAGYHAGDRTTEDIPFIDVSIDTPYYNEICTMYERGIISGTSETMFSPNASVTFAQAVKMIIQVLGYMGYSELRYGEYPMGPIRTAEEFKIIKGVQNIAWNAELSAEDAMTLLYNAGTAYVIDPMSIDREDGAHYVMSDKTLFESGNDLLYGEGIMECNGIASTKENGVVADMVVIDGVTYGKPNIDIKDMLGCKVNYFYISNGIETRVVWAEIDKDTEIMEINALDLASGDPSYNVRNIVYYKNRRDKETLSIYKYAPIVYNNDYVLIPVLRHVTPQTGKIRLIDNNDDEVYDAVIVEEFYNVLVKYYDPANDIATDKYGRSILFDEYKTVKVVKDGEEIDRSTITPNTVLSCVVNDAKTKIYAYVTNERHDGKLISVMNDEYTFEDGTYRLSQDYANGLHDSSSTFYKYKPEVGENCVFYLDVMGEIAAFAEGDEELKYALIMNVYEGTRADAGIVYTRLMLSDGTKITGETNKKINIGIGDSVTRYDSTILLDKDANQFNLYASGNKKLIPQIVQVLFNAEGKLTELRFALDNSDKTGDNKWNYYDLDNFSKDYTTDNAYVRTDGGYLLDNQYMIDGDVVIFANWLNSSDAEPYSVFNRTLLGSGTKGKIEVYDAGNDLIPEVLFWKDYKDELTEWMDSMMIVEEMDVIYEDGMQLQRVTGVINGARQTVAEADEGIYAAAEVKAGDLIRIANRNSHATAAEVMLTKEEIASKTPAVLEGENPTVGTRGATRYAPIYNVTEMGIITINPTTWQETYGALNYAGYKNSKAIFVTIYDISDGTTTIGDIHDVYQICQPMRDKKLSSEPTGNMVILTTKDTAITNLILVKD